MNRRYMPPKLDRDGYYAALDIACSSAKDKDLGFELLTRVKGVPPAKISEKDLTNERIRVSHCKNESREESFKTSELLVIQSYTGNHAVLAWEADALGFEPPRMLSAHERYDQLNRQIEQREKQIADLQAERSSIAPVIKDCPRRPVLVAVPGYFAAKRAQ